MSFSSTSKGQYYEALASDYLQQQGLTLIETNYHSQFGEVDLIMFDQQVLCFIEVKFRQKKSFGGAVSAIPPAKQKKIVKTAQCYILSKPTITQRPMRFDAVILQFESSVSNLSIEWIKSAFYAE